MILKYFIAAILSTSSMSADGQNEWFLVEKSQNSREQAEEEDSSIWMLFVKSLGLETIQLRFPSEPEYRYVENGDLEISAQKNGELFQLTVREFNTSSPLTKDLLYQSEGMWVREHFIQTENHLYHFKTVSFDPKNESHREFIFSFSIEKNG